jgi:hypothetical protein
MAGVVVVAGLNEELYLPAEVAPDFVPIQDAGF